MTVVARNVATIDEELTDLASEAVRVLKRFLKGTGKTPSEEVQRAKAATASLGAWAKWQQTSTARAALQFAMEKHAGVGALPAGHTAVDDGVTVTV